MPSKTIEISHNLYVNLHDGDLMIVRPNSGHGGTVVPLVTAKDYAQRYGDNHKGKQSGFYVGETAVTLSHGTERLQLSHSEADDLVALIGGMG